MNNNMWHIDCIWIIYKWGGNFACCLGQWAQFNTSQVTAEKNAYRQLTALVVTTRLTTTVRKYTQINPNIDSSWTTCKNTNEYCKTLFFRSILISRFPYVENSLHFNFADFPANFIKQFVSCFFFVPLTNVIIEIHLVSQVGR